MSRTVMRSIPLSEYEDQIIRAEADARGRSKASFIRFAVSEWIKEHGKVKLIPTSPVGFERVNYEDGREGEYR